jgi:competence protein CoiA
LNWSLGSLECQAEVISQSTTAAWRADTYFEVEGRRVVIELQRSYQHLDDFLRRQQRDVDAGVENYWLLRHDNFFSLTRALAKLRLKREFGGKLPSNNVFPCIPELPVAYLETRDTPVVKSVNFLQVPLGDWLTAVMERRFRWDNGSWMIA